MAATREVFWVFEHPRNFRQKIDTQKCRLCDSRLSHFVTPTLFLWQKLLPGDVFYTPGNAPKSFSARALPRTPLGAAYSAPPETPWLVGRSWPPLANNPTPRRPSRPQTPPKINPSYAFGLWHPLTATHDMVWNGCYPHSGIFLQTVCIQNNHFIAYALQFIRWMIIHNNRSITVCIQLANYVFA